MTESGNSLLAETKSYAKIGPRHSAETKYATESRAGLLAKKQNGNFVSFRISWIQKLKCMKAFPCTTVHSMCLVTIMLLSQNVWCSCIAASSAPDLWLMKHLWFGFFHLHFHHVRHGSSFQVHVVYFGCSVVTTLPSEYNLLQWSYWSTVVCDSVHNSVGHESDTTTAKDQGQAETVQVLQTSSRPLLMSWSDRKGTCNEIEITQPALGQFWSFSAKTTHRYGQKQKPLQCIPPKPKLNDWNNCYFGVKTRTGTKTRPTSKMVGQSQQNVVVLHVWILLHETVVSVHKKYEQYTTKPVKFNTM